MSSKWPTLDYLGWRETCSALHLYLQVVGKYRLAHTPWLNHSWNATFYVTPSGLTSSLIPDGPGIEIVFDFHDHMVSGTGGDGRKASFALGEMTVAAFHAKFTLLITELGGTPDFHGQPNEVADSVPFDEDHRDRPYDRDAVQKFHQALLAIDGVSKHSGLPLSGNPAPYICSGEASIWRSHGFRDGMRQSIPAAYRHCRTTWRRRPMTGRFLRPASGLAAAA